MSNLIRLRLLSPKVIRTIQSGGVLTVGSEELIKKGFPADWTIQEQMLIPN